ncbi:AAA family ATPase [Marinoscillum furvescens]|uniref:MoxR-like ATPase n=1 Tax=Marinoscillum furvescens DSM 4134 TaxID=1122208 RepID=A0A3D9L6W3_MARFU|nr:MoxR family ATPase [Marinoscillum furvescens]REE01621.1 MoxR-like ATPase [Marinoscillum furvescens DSM 4134]
MAELENEVEVANELHAAYQKLEAEIGKVIVGQKDVVRLMITSIFCGGHALLVGVPGLAKTLLVQTIAKSLGLEFNRIQFTPDLMPSDVLGAETLDQERNFRFIKGPVFANVILADEINRTPPKTQSALLEAMQEGAVTIGGKNHQLDKPFFVLATQNPIEQEGTYPLPEAQLDRFMFMIKLEYPSLEDELNIIKQTTTAVNSEVEKELSKADILKFQQLVRKVPVADNVFEYIVQLVHKTRPQTAHSAAISNEYLEWGAGPRASQFLVLAAKCNALINGKYSPDIEDVKAVAEPILRHRIVRNFKAEAEGKSEEMIVQELL